MTIRSDFEAKNQGPITQAEMIEMFGETMPIEAAKLLHEASGETTCDELRAKLRAIARDCKPAPSDFEAIAREIIQSCYGKEDFIDALIPAIAKALEEEREKAQAAVEKATLRAATEAQLGEFTDEQWANIERRTDAIKRASKIAKEAPDA